MSWCTIESDPGVFTELVEKFGVSGCEFAELYSLDDGELARHAPVFGLIFLFKWTGEKDDRATLSFDEAPPGLFYAKQMVNNARATQAILSVLLNCEHPFVSDEKRATADDDVFHFVAYVPSGGKVYELDGLKAGPIDLGSFEDSWLPVARSAIEARIQKYAASEIKFNLMAIVRDKRAALEDAKAAADAATAAELDAELARERRADWPRQRPPPPPVPSSSTCSVPRSRASSAP
ncbi:hypothetical protein JL722_12592 [Aureococcus anophagefferens]|nr:hypothetical protein JL722_12592 [Aureococcus anophagefferens]